MINKKKILKNVVALILVVGTLAGVTINHLNSKASEMSSDKKIEISTLEDWDKVNYSDFSQIDFSQFNIDWESLENEIDDEILEEIDKIFEENIKLREAENAVTPTFAKYYSQLENMTEDEFNKIFNSEKYKIEYRDVYQKDNTRGGMIGILVEGVNNAVNLIGNGTEVTIWQQLIDLLKTQPILITAVVTYISTKFPGFLTRQLREFVGEDWKSKLMEAIASSKGNIEAFKTMLKTFMPENLATILVDFFTIGRRKQDDSENNDPTVTQEPTTSDTNNNE